MEDRKPKTMSVPDAGRLYFGLGRNASYAAAAAGTLPIIRICRRLFVKVPVLERMLEADTRVNCFETEKSQLREEIVI